MSYLPPFIPESEAEVDRIYELLKQRVQTDLDKGERAEIKQLIGIYPTPAQAVVWRQLIKRKRDEALALVKKPEGVEPRVGR